MNLNFDPDRKFKITLSSIFSLRNYVGTNGFSDYNQRNLINVKNSLNNLLNPADGIIDGGRLKDLIFPTECPDATSFDVFISHSHNNINEAKKLAAYLRHKYGLTPFLDNYVWESADDLLKKIDKSYCIHSNGHNYSYEKRNFSTSHVHTMLSMSILEMIAQCKSFIFIESNESLDLNVLKERGERTLSPWLYQELQFVRFLSMVRQSLNEQREFSTGGSLQIRYPVDLSDFKELNIRNIDQCFK